MKIIKKMVFVSTLVIVSFIVLYNVAIFVVSNNEELSIKVCIKIYEENKTIHNLENLCTVLSYSADYDNKIKYFDVYVNDGYADQIALEIAPNSSFHQKSYVNDYKFEYYISLLHTDRYVEFQKNYEKNVCDISTQNAFYHMLSYDLLNHEWSQEQLGCVHSMLEKDAEKNYLNDKLRFQNYCLIDIVNEAMNSTGDGTMC